MRFAKYFALLLILACLLVPAYAEETQPQPLSFVKGSWTLVLLPDTQIYAEKYPKTFLSQAQWIADHAADRNIRFVMSEGDVTNRNTPDQWTTARAAYSLLDGKVPYGLVLGNHDYTHKPLAERATLANEYFPPELIRKSPAYGGVYERGKLDNTYYLFSAGGRDWVALSLEFAPRDGVLRWANKVLDVYSSRSAMICTHGYLDIDGRRFDYQGPKKRKMAGDVGEGLNDAEMIWQKLASKHANVVFVFCGHMHVPAVRQESKGDAGNTVHEILSDYQGIPNGGDGYLRLMEFLPDGKTVQVKTYSTTRNDYKTDPTNQFTLDIAPAPVKPPEPVEAPVEAAAS